MKLIDFVLYLYISVLKTFAFSLLVICLENVLLFHCIINT